MANQTRYSFRDISCSFIWIALFSTAVICTVCFCLIINNLISTSNTDKINILDTKNSGTLTFLALLATLFVFSLSEILKKINLSEEKRIRLVQTLKEIRLFLKVWNHDLKTMANIKWGGQLNWLMDQYDGKTQTALGLYPHEFFEFDQKILRGIPEKIGEKKLDDYKDSLVSVLNKIRHLNFIVKKIHCRGSPLSDDEKNEIISLISGNNKTGIIHTLTAEIPLLYNETQNILEKIGDKD